MKTLIVAALAASTISLAGPASALTTASDPISIQKTQSAWADPFTGVPSVVHVSYANTAAVAASEVTFRFNDAAGHQIDVEDVGTFSQGVTINHEFRLRGFGDVVTARVHHVELADGSVWDEAVPTAQPRRQAPADGRHVESLPAPRPRQPAPATNPNGTSYWL